ncbi:hypothetical protein Tco_1082251 [Tanacetum coccineum]|uniref:Histone deacetylase 14 n=1 Tax=Tanacetum coccineum TaxID=301880 RepID=A0ABQ5HZT9_9ASTR
MVGDNVPAPTPTRSDEQILPFKAWLPVGKGNLLLDLQNLQKNPWFTLNDDLLSKALEITPVDPPRPFVSPPVGEHVMDSVNELGYPEEIYFVSKMHVNNLYQPWRGILSLIIQCLTGKTSAIQIFFAHQANLNVPTKKLTPHVIPYCRYTRLIIFYLGSEHNIHKRPGSSVYVTRDDYLLGNLKFVPKGKKDEVFGKPISKELITEAIRNSSYYQQYLEMVARKPTTKEGGQKKTTNEAPVGEVAIREPTSGPKGKSTTDQYIFQRRTPMTEEASTRPLPQPEDDTSANIVHDTPSPLDAEIGTGAEMSDKERTDELDEGQAGSDPGNTLESRPPPDEDQAGLNPRPSHVALAGPNIEPMHEDFIAMNPTSLYETLSSMKNLDDAFTYGDQFLYDKTTKEEPSKANVETEVESMVNVPIHQASLTVPPLSTLVINLIQPKLVSPLIQEPIFTATTTTTTTTFPPPPPPQQQITTNPRTDMCQL